MGYLDNSMDLDSNLSNEAPSADWYNQTYGEDAYPSMSQFQPQQSQFDYMESIPQGTFEMPQQNQFGFGGEGVGIQPSPLGELPQNFNFDMGGVGQTLQNLFSGQGGNAMLKGIGALMEGSQNKKKAQALQNIVSQNRQAIDPFGSQRPFYQQQLQSAVQNPYQAAIVRDQVNNIAQMQARKDAAAGRRSNMATSSPAMLAAQAQIAQQYMNSLMGPAGSNIQPNSNALLNMLGQAANADVQGYMSPIMSALGNVQQTNSLADMFKNMSTSDRVALQQALSRQGQ